MVNNEYSIIALVCSLICILVTRADMGIEVKEERNKGRFTFLLHAFLLFSVVDAVWGFFATGTLNFGYWGFYIASFAFHFCATVVAYIWYLFANRQYGFEGNLVIKILEFIPEGAGLVILLVQLIKGGVFVIGEDLSYTSGPLRSYLFGIQFLYFIYALFKATIFYIRKGRKESETTPSATLGTLLIPILAGIMQLFFTHSPYYSLGFLFTAIAVFNGSIVISKNEQNLSENAVSKQKSKEIYSALETLCKSFVSVHLFDLELNKQVEVKSTPQIDAFINPEDDANTQIRKVMEGVCSAEYKDELGKFVDTYTLPERMIGKNSISFEFLGKNEGWCISNFLKVEQDENGYATKVIHCVQNVNENRVKEKEYEKALTRAYENKNAIYAELLKMQSTGVIATDEDENVLIANDMALAMFNHEGEDVETLSYGDLVKDASLSDVLESTKAYRTVRGEGGAFTYELSVNEDNDLPTRYLMADARLIRLFDGSKVMITCYTDITDSKSMEEKLRVLSEVDALTNLLNRGCGERKTETMLAANVEGMFALMDVNKFKQINDAYGHVAGDKTLIAVADALKASFRESDIIMRLGGDEFAIYSPSVTDYDIATQRIQRFFDRIHAIEIDEIPSGKISVSLGAVLIEKDNGVIMENFASIYKMADKAMYSCKNLPGSNLKFYRKDVNYSGDE